MDIDISQTTDKEIQDIIEKLKDKGYKQVDEAYVEKDSPFITHPGTRDNWKNKANFVMYPKLLSYYRKEKGKSGWVTIPWICVDTTVYFDNEENLRSFAKWLVDEFKSIELQPFMDEDSFQNHFTRINKKEEIELKLYINPSYPKGYWSNHAL